MSVNDSSHADALTSAIGAPLSVFVLSVALLIIFVLLAKVCDEALAPILEHASHTLGIPPDVAAATLLAFASSAPEIVISCVSTFGNPSDTQGALSLSMGTVFGSAIVAFTVIPALCVFATPTGFMELELVPLLRDVGFYSMGVLMFFLFAMAGTVSWVECLGLLILYLLYLLSMRALMRFYMREQAVQKLENDPTDVEDTQVGGSRTAHEQEESNDLLDAHQVEYAEPSSSRCSCFKYWLPPYCFGEPEKLKTRWRLLFVISMVYVVALAEACVQVTILIGDVLGVADHVLGVLLVVGACD